CRASRKNTVGRTWILPVQPGAAARTRAPQVVPSPCWCSSYRTTLKKQYGHFLPFDLHVRVNAMSRVDFAFGAVDRLRTACDTVRKQFLSGRRLVVYAADRSLLKRFDHMLWGFEATAFIPHVWVNDPLAETTPVLLTVDPP